jgi:hypothetical protein
MDDIFMAVNSEDVVVDDADIFEYSDKYYQMPISHFYRLLF